MQSPGVQHSKFSARCTAIFTSTEASGRTAMSTYILSCTAWSKAWASGDLQKLSVVLHKCSGLFREGMVEVVTQCQEDAFNPSRKRVGQFCWSILHWYLYPMSTMSKPTLAQIAEDKDASWGEAWWLPQAYSSWHDQSR
jgi:hypothetical protein